MKLATSLFLIFILSNEITSQTTSETLALLRTKVINLEANKQIRRDYEAYTEPELKDNETYDFIIVGSGSAGSVLIRRLSEVWFWKILVLEAGGEPDILTDIPFWSPLTMESDEFNWKYVTEVQENFGLAFENQRMFWPRGKGLGGSTLINNMIHSRGAKEDYDAWAAAGNSGWSYIEVLPYFKKLETCLIKKQDVLFRGHLGPVHVEDAYSSRAGDIFVKAANNAGYRTIDYNGKSQDGVSHSQGTIKRGLRCSGERCYIRPVKNRWNLTIRLHSHVTKVIIENKKARSVEFLKNGKTYRAYVRKEVILSAGVINSPQILLLSGVGPKEQLEKFGIPSVVDLPVGQKIYDHAGFRGLGFLIDESLQYNKTAALEDEAFIQLYNYGTGVLRNLGFTDSLLFTQKAPDNRNKIELVLYSSHFIENPNDGVISKDFYEKMFKEYAGRNAITCGVMLLHPNSHGFLELKSSDPLDHPKLFGGYFTDPTGEDMKTMIAGIREAIRVMRSPPFDRYGIQIIDKPLVGCEYEEYDSDEYWECAVRTLTGPGSHQTSTCKMGSADDEEAVVDEKLKVYGVSKLRVVDASIIPTSISGHPNIPTMMIGEKAADMIKKEHLF